MEQKIIEKYLVPCTQIKNHRFKSWEHCYEYFGKEGKDFDEDVASLHLAFYLASWGMYRGSSFLLQRDYKFLTPVVQTILKHRDLRTMVVTLENKAEFIAKLFSLVEELKTYFKQEYPDLKKIKNAEREASPTLITKIILGTLGITPAYDRYFKDGVKTESIPQSFSESSFGKLIDYTLENKEAIASIQNWIKQTYGKEYSTMKIVDMYFWQKGYNTLIKTIQQ